MNSPRRRALLGAVGLGAVGLTAGCVGDGALSDENATSEPPASAAGRKTTLDPRHADDLFLHNETSEDRLLDVRVSRSEGGNGNADGEDGENSDDSEIVVAGRYDVPSSAKLELPNVAAIGERYAVDAREPGEEWQRFDWLVADCEAYHTPTEDPERTPDPDRTLNADAVVLLTDEGLDFGRNSCDGIFVTERGAVPASDHAVDRDSTTS